MSTKENAEGSWNLLDILMGKKLDWTHRLVVTLLGGPRL